MNNDKPIIWTISGADCSGGAGIAADIKTGHSLNTEVCHLITVNTVQNSEVLVSVNPVASELLLEQVECLLTDKVPSAIKIGLIANKEQVAAIVTIIENVRQANKNVKVIYDPVGQASVGGKFNQLTSADLKPLLIHVDVLTPNVIEAGSLSQRQGSTLKEIAQSLLQLGCNSVVIKGGHAEGDISSDVCYHQLINEMQLEKLDTTEIVYTLKTPRIGTSYSHGGGCSFASALACFIAHGYLLRDALVLTKAFINQGLTAQEGKSGYYGAFEQTNWPQQKSLFPVAEDEVIRKYQSLPSFPSLGIIRGDGEKLGLYPVIGSLEWLAKLLPLNLNIVQLRLKGYQEAELEPMIKEAVEMCKGSNTRLFINDYWQLAIKHGAYGVHIGQEDLISADLAAIHASGLRLGISTHGCYEFLLAQQLKPSYLAVGAIFETKTKDMSSQLQGVDNLKQILTLSTDIPVVAIGGINHDRAPEVWQTGVDSLAVVTAITEAEDYVDSVDTFKTIMSD